MSTHKLGETIEHERKFAGFRDAFHVAGVLCELHESDDPESNKVYAGCPVRFTGDSYTKVTPSPPENAHGFVDFFLPHGKKITVMDDVLFWVMLKPGLSKNLQHNYELEIEDVEETNEWNCQGCQ